jgi:pyruvate dehydrogenase kinase 2/3/4
MLLGKVPAENFQLEHSFLVSPVTLREMMKFGSNADIKNIILIAQFLHNEMPIRLAHLLRDLNRLPQELAETEPLK